MLGLGVEDWDMGGHTEGGNVLVVPGVAVRDRRAVPDARNLGRANNVLVGQQRFKPLNNVLERTKIF